MTEKEMTLDVALGLVEQVIVNYRGTKAEHDLLTEALARVKKAVAFAKEHQK